MDIGSIFLILGLLILVVLYVSRPLFERRATAVSVEEHELSALLAERDRILNTLQELEFDNLLGKIPEDEFPAQRALLMQRGVDILRKVDAFQPSAHPESAEDRLEAVIAARRQSLALQLAAVRANGNGIPVPDDELERVIASRRRVRQEKAAGFCPKCGGTLQQSDRFCPKCGASLN